MRRVMEENGFDLSILFGIEGFYEMAAAELGELACSSGLDEICGSVPPDHPFSLASINGAEVRVR